MKLENPSVRHLSVDGISHCGYNFRRSKRALAFFRFAGDMQTSLVQLNITELSSQNRMLMALRHAHALRTQFNKDINIGYHMIHTSQHQKRHMCMGDGHFSGGSYGGHDATKDAFSPGSQGKLRDDIPFTFQIMFRIIKGPLTVIIPLVAAGAISSRPRDPGWKRIEGEST